MIGFKLSMQMTLIFYSNRLNDFIFLLLLAGPAVFFVAVVVVFYSFFNSYFFHIYCLQRKAVPYWIFKCFFYMKITGQTLGRRNYIIWYGKIVLDIWNKSLIVIQNIFNGKRYLFVQVFCYL